jgi:positive regulator of sigma E activity
LYAWKAFQSDKGVACITNMKEEIVVGNYMLKHIKVGGKVNDVQSTLTIEINLNEKACLLSSTIIFYVCLIKILLLY